MSITSAIVLFAIIWFMVFFIAIPIRLETQGDRGDIVPGTHASSPEVHNLKKKAWISTWVTFVFWAIVCGIIVSDLLTCLLYTSPSPRDGLLSRMPSSA